MKVVTLSHTEKPERIVAMAARLCYSGSNLNALTIEYSEDEIDKLLKRIMNLGHFSVLEHASFTFGIEGISRVTSHQLVRHRIASYSQQSQRYVKMENISSIVPSDIDHDEELKEEFSKICEEALTLYTKMVEKGVSKEDARFILPSAAETKIIVTMNARELLHFFNLRCCNRAQWEIRELSKKMLKQVKEIAPIIFANGGPRCLMGNCPEGPMTCGKVEEVRREFNKL